MKILIFLRLFSVDPIIIFAHLKTDFGVGDIKHKGPLSAGPRKGSSKHTNYNNRFPTLSFNPVCIFYNSCTLELPLRSQPKAGLCA